ncbi:HAMP domain-containing histidine kinase [Clostridium sp. MSJ-11]|uniref:histidine kinase n=1 Tax=Clostridium mobile TaxID=2841512 RepID=A0ABS6EIR3_9CLOT|nr:HAMP domain-containing sensor histidine kinase [Clostridium mobile]MBU5485118.1 HAMP domain-containing histidine kinase [Clostridium mobile]
MKFSIKHKISLSFVLLIFFTLIALVSYSYQILKKNNYYVINKEITETKKNLDLYIKQYFELNNMELNKISFKVEGLNLSKELGYRLGTQTVLYDSDGNIISSLPKNEILESENLLKAKDGSVAYSIINNKNKYMVSLSYPIMDNNKIIGIIQYTRDYSTLFKGSKDFISRILMFSILIFIIAVLISHLISKEITKPITELTLKSQEISRGNWDTYINIKSQDEIGKLGYSFNAMINKIKEQINIISRDRDTLKELSSQQKNFFDNVTHELKTPLTTIVGYSEILKDNGFSDKDFFDRATSRIISEGNRLNRMVIELLELSKTNSMDFSYHFDLINTSPILRQTCEEMLIKAKRYNMNINLSLEPNLMIHGNEDKIKEVFINIIDNSIKYGDVNSQIKISTSIIDNMISVVVEDKGRGISHEDLENIFNPFYRVSKNESREQGSNGLGLSIVKAILEKHNGDILIQSELKVGTKVTILIPEGKI